MCMRPAARFSTDISVKIGVYRLGFAVYIKFN